MVYKDTLVSSCYTLGIQDTDLIGLVENLTNRYFLHAIKFICDICEYDYYERSEYENESKVLQWLDQIENLTNSDEEEKIKPIPESVLLEYLPYPHTDFLNDNISIQTQKEFEICYSLKDDRIMIPIRDELGYLIGDKGRTIHQEEVDAGRKYLPNYKYPKTKILYGLYKTLPYIKEKNETIIVESEKGCMQLWSAGIKNSVAIGGHILSENQMEKIIKLNTNVVIAYDKVSKERIKHYNEMIKNIQRIVKELSLYTKVSVIYDKWGMLKDRESPTDNIESFKFLYENRYKVLDNTKII